MSADPRVRTPQGRGRRTWADGTVFEGDFVADKLHGPGYYTTSEGNRFPSVWERNVMVARVPKAARDEFERLFAANTEAASSAAAALGVKPYRPPTPEAPDPEAYPLGVAGRPSKVVRALAALRASGSVRALATTALPEGVVAAVAAATSPAHSMRHVTALQPAAGADAAAEQPAAGARAGRAGGFGIGLEP